MQVIVIDKRDTELNVINNNNNSNKLMLIHSLEKLTVK